MYRSAEQVRTGEYPPTRLGVKVFQGFYNGAYMPDEAYDNDGDWDGKLDQDGWA